MTTQIKKSESQTPEELISELQAQLATLKIEAAKLVDERITALTAAVREHPLPAIGIAFGLGYVVARLMRNG